MILRVWATLLLVLVSSSWAAESEGRIVKVLHHLVDAEGRNALAPSLFERDAYQVHLRDNPELVAGSRFDLQYKASRKQGPVRLKIEVRGSKTGLGKAHTFEGEDLPSRWGKSWARIELNKAASDALGRIIAWRATLWRGDEQLAAHESFLW